MKKTIKKLSFILAMVCSFCLLCAFSDVPENHWAYSIIYNAYKAGLVSGYGGEGLDDVYDGKFGPEDTTTKQEMALMVYRAVTGNRKLGTEDNYSEEYLKTLEKCNIASWAYKGVSVGFKLEYLDEEDFLEDGTYSGNGEVTRETIAKWISKGSLLKTSSLSILPYKDIADISQASYKYIDSLYRYEYMIGDNGCFYPEGKTNRAEAATVCLNVLNSDLSKYNKLSVLRIEKYAKAENFDTAKRVFTMDGNVVHIDEDAVILLDGEEVSFDRISKLSGKNICVASVAGQGKVVLVQTTPKVYSGSVQSIESLEDFTLIVIKINDISIPYCITSDTQCSHTPDLGDTIKFIPDGCTILEVF